jgi:UDP-N-acetylmuramate--alanine ligase
MRGSFGICIAGTHGKTTTSSMIAQTMLAAGLRPSYIIGGKIVGHAAGDCAGRGEFLVAEACEYDRSFLSLHPAYAVLTNLEPDHLDYYGNEKNLVEAFGRFISLIPKCGLLLVNRDSPRAFEVSKAARCRVETFGLGNDCDWQVTTVEGRGHGHSFELRRGTAKHTFHVQVPGYHNVLNAAAAAALSVNLGITPQAAASGLASFRGVERRFQVLTGELPITVIDDYAHHPTEVAASLRAARETYPGHRIWAVFQAHQHSRTRMFFEEFARSLTHADRVTIAKIYSVRETDMDRLSVSGADIAGRLSQLGVETEYAPTFEAVESLLLREALEGDVLIVMGAGDIYTVAHSVATTLRERANSELSSAKATL